MVPALITGVAMWAIGRRGDRTGHESAVATLRDGLCWAVVTMTTVGYGDKTPKTTSGRLVAMVWVFGSLVLVSLRRPIDRALINVTSSPEWNALEARVLGL